MGTVGCNELIQYEFYAFLTCVDKFPEVWGKTSGWRIIYVYSSGKLSKRKKGSIRAILYCCEIQPPEAVVVW